MSVSNQRGDNEKRGNQGDKGEGAVGPDPLQGEEADEAADSRASPVVRNIRCGSVVTEASHGGLAKETDEDASDGNFSTYIEEDGKRAETKVVEAPRASVSSRVVVASLNHIRKMDEVWLLSSSNDSSK